MIQPEKLKNWKRERRNEKYFGCISVTSAPSLHNDTLFDLKKIDPLVLCVRIPDRAGHIDTRQQCVCVARAIIIQMSRV